MTQKEVEAYKAFMYNMDNAHNCANCPENRMENRSNQLPCGQYHCWVELHHQKGE